MAAQEFIEERKMLKRLRKLSPNSMEDNIAITYNGRGNIYKYTRSGRRADLPGFIPRSGWEANIARVLYIHGIEFQFEPRTFYFPIERGVRGYVPDFYLPKTDEFIEVKGYFDDRSRIKLKRFKKYYPEEFSNLTMIISKSSSRAKNISIGLGVGTILYYEDFRNTYKPKINNWEGK